MKPDFSDVRLSFKMATLRVLIKIAFRLKRLLREAPEK